MQNLLDELKNLLAAHQRFTFEGRLVKQVVIDAAQALDTQLLQLLLSHDALKRHFFQQVGDIQVFDKVKLLRFVSNKAFLEDSYTAFKNKIGLLTKNSDGMYDSYLSDSKQVVLAYPYKDCMLEGGQTKEAQKRNELFWNETLAPDDIDRLTAPKAFTNLKRYDIQGAHPNPSDINLNDNFIIKGNNLLALYSLLPVYRGKVKLIYIDPPYNTGNDGFQYNDAFNHSTWLTFMKDRLKIARELLSDEGVIMIQMTGIEQHYLRVIMDEIYKKENFIGQIIWKKRGGAPNDKIIVSIHEYIIIHAKNKLTLKLYRKERGENILSRYANPDNHPKGAWSVDNLMANVKGGRFVASLYFPIVNPNTQEEHYPSSNGNWRFTYYCTFCILVNMLLFCSMISASFFFCFSIIGLSH
jgi:adenine-specific DNA-methyltransferase